jgi:hypothetical protein
MEIPTTYHNFRICIKVGTERMRLVVAIFFLICHKNVIAQTSPLINSHN